jgi:hypothetical protein
MFEMEAEPEVNPENREEELWYCVQFDEDSPPIMMPIDDNSLLDDASEKEALIDSAFASTADIMGCLRRVAMSNALRLFVAVFLCARSVPAQSPALDGGAKPLVLQKNDGQLRIRRPVTGRNFPPRSERVFSD